MEILEKLKDATYSRHKYFRVYIFIVDAESAISRAKWKLGRKIKSLKSSLNARNPFRKTLWNLDKNWYQRWNGM